MTGNWRLITHQASATADPVTKNVFSLWLDHGTRPDSASYAYVVIPAVTEGILSRYAAKPEVEILANTADIQAVKNNSLGISQVVFYQPGTIAIAPGIKLTAKSPCIAMINMKAGKITGVSVVDPTHKLASLELEITSPVSKSGSNFTTSWNPAKKSTTIKIDLPKEGMAGSSVVLKM